MFSRFLFLFLSGFLAPKARIFWELNRLCLAAAPVWSPGDVARWSVFHDDQSSDADGARKAESCTPEREWETACRGLRGRTLYHI